MVKPMGNPSSKGDWVLWHDGARVLRRGKVVAVVPPGADPLLFLPKGVGRGRVRFRRLTCSRAFAHLLVEVFPPGDRKRLSWFFLPQIFRVTTDNEGIQDMQAKAATARKKVPKGMQNLRARKVLADVNQKLKDRGIEMRVELASDPAAPTLSPQLRMAWAPPEKKPKPRTNHRWVQDQSSQRSVERCSYCGFFRMLRGSSFVFRANADTDWSKWRVSCALGPGHV